VCLISLVGLSQNWNAFNKAYRYNYRYNNSALISNVLFADTVYQSGSDTIYNLNRIGVECTNSCPTVTAPLNQANHLIPNVPQFMQRKIRKYSNGTLLLFDTTKIIIRPFCGVNESWLFDSIYNKTAVCIAKSTQNVLGVIDSVKTILIGGVDTFKLSKNFGVIMFPDLYAKNKY
jgi:hypothetical protein